jgi:hypothetical protein
MSQPIISSVQELPLKTIPSYYTGMSNNPTVSRFKNQEVNENFPFVVEYLSGSLPLNAQGKNTDTITFKKQVHAAIPIIEGMIEQPDMTSPNILPIQTYFEYIVLQFGIVQDDEFPPLFSGIGTITKNGFTFNVNTKFIRTYDADTDTTTYSYPYAGQFFKYKLWVLRLTM